jgi:hypothetical protein
MIRGSLLLVVLLVALAGEPPGRAADAPLTTSATSAPLTTSASAPKRFALSFAGGSGASPQGHFGLRLAYTRGRVEASLGLGMFFGADPRTEDSSGMSPTALTHLVPSLGAHYVALRRAKLELVPGLGLSLQPVHYEESTTRPSYDTVQWTWQSAAGLRLDAELEARLPLGDAWFASAVVGWGLFVYIPSCYGTTTVFGFPCDHPPSPAYSAPMPLANTPYAQLALGRRF